MSDTRAPVSVSQAMIAEFVGTFLLVFFGCGAVHAAVIMGAQSGLWQVAIVWGVAIMLAIFAVDAISGAHINPAMTLAFATWGGFPWSRVVPYILAQLLGAMGAASLLYFLFSGFIAAKETQTQIVRGEPNSVQTAMVYGEYAPNPGSLSLVGNAAWSDPSVSSVFSHQQACVAEFAGTFILACLVFAMIDARNLGRPAAHFAPVFIGLTVSVLISVLAPLTQACFNPARDFGPRMVAYFAGWGEAAFPGSDNWMWLTVYILAPIAGAIVGGGFQKHVLGPAYPQS